MRRGSRKVKQIEIPELIKLCEPLFNRDTTAFHAEGRDKDEWYLVVDKELMFRVVIHNGWIVLRPVRKLIPWSVKVSGEWIVIHFEECLGLQLNVKEVFDLAVDIYHGEKRAFFFRFKHPETIRWTIVDVIPRVDVVLREISIGLKVEKYLGCEGKCIEHKYAVLISFQIPSNEGGE